MAEQRGGPWSSSGAGRAGHTPPPAPDAGPVDRGTPGRSARQEYQRQHARREQRLEERWGRLAGLAKLLTDDPQSTRAWARGAQGEELVGQRLERAVSDRTVLLYDRRVPRSRRNIDVVAVAPSGVWVIDVKRYSGRVQRRDVGGFFRSDVRLYVGGRDRSALAAGMGWQVAAVTDALGVAGVPVHAALCFSGAEWGLLAKPFRFAGVWVMWPGALAGRLNGDGPLDPGVIRHLARTIGTALPSR